MRITIKSLIEEYYTKFNIGRREMMITLFTEAGIVSQPTIEITASESHTAILARLYLDHCGVESRILQHFGMLSTLYVTKMPKMPAEEQNS